MFVSPWMRASIHALAGVARPFFHLTQRGEKHANAFSQNRRPPEGKTHVLNNSCLAPRSLVNRGKTRPGCRLGVVPIWHKKSSVLHGGLPLEKINARLPKVCAGLF